MIETLTVPLGRFDLDGFVAAYCGFYHRWAGDSSEPDASLWVVTRFDDTPTPFPQGESVTEALLEHGGKVFFPMHEPLADDRALCIDGARLFSEDFDIGVADAYGFLVEVHDGQVSLHPALYDGTSDPFPTIDLQGHCGVLDECMERHARRFVKQAGE
jgi:hypothetical protein